MKSLALRVILIIMFAVDRDDIAHVLNILRRGTITWRKRAECLRQNRKEVFVRTGAKGQSITKYYYYCNGCGSWFPDIKSIEVDHIDEVGPFEGNFDSYVRRMYCRLSNLTTLCTVCHMKKTRKYMSARAKWRRK